MTVGVRSCIVMDAVFEPVRPAASVALPERKLCAGLGPPAFARLVDLTQPVRGRWNLPVARGRARSPGGSPRARGANAGLLPRDPEHLLPGVPRPAPVERRIAPMSISTPTLTGAKGRPWGKDFFMARLMPEGS